VCVLTAPGGVKGIHSSQRKYCRHLPPNLDPGIWDKYRVSVSCRRFDTFWEETSFWCLRTWSKCELVPGLWSSVLLARDLEGIWGMGAGRGGYSPGEGTWLRHCCHLTLERLWNNVKCQLDAIRWFYWCILSSTCFGYIRPSSGALDVELQHMVFCTEFVDGCTAPSAPYTRPTQRLSEPPPIQKLGAENYMLQLNI